MFLYNLHFSNIILCSLIIVVMSIKMIFMENDHAARMLSWWSLTDMANDVYHCWPITWRVVFIPRDRYGMLPDVQSRLSMSTSVK